jgi:dinuclear metal center YbgI/SA1388 family protein
MPMTELRDLVSFCDELLDTGSFSDYCPNGLQVEAGETVSTLVSGVTASQALIDAAAEAGADALLVHHGYFWKGEAQPLTGMKGRRVHSLYSHGISLIAYHLPLDAHIELGNNRQLADRLGLAGEPLESGGLVWGAELDETPEQLSLRLHDALGREPLLLSGGPGRIRRVGWCTGAAQGYIEQAAAAGCDAFISGEVSEQTLHQAAELGIHYFAAGHHATERYGVQALGEALAGRFGIRHRFIDIPNPV